MKTVLNAAVTAAYAVLASPSWLASRTVSKITLALKQIPLVQKEQSRI